MSITIKEILEVKQPNLLHILVAYCDKKTNQPKVKINDAIARDLMRHDAYTRGRGGLRQIRHGQ